MQDLLQNEKALRILSKTTIAGMLFFFLWIPVLLLQDTIFFDEKDYPYLSVLIIVPFFLWGIVCLVKKLWIPGIALLYCGMSQIHNESYLNRFIESSSDVLIISSVCIAITILAVFLYTRDEYQNKIYKLWLFGFVTFMLFFSIFRTIYFPSYNDIFSENLSWVLVRYLALFTSILPLLIVAVIASHIHQSVKPHTFIFYALSVLLIFESLPINYGESFIAAIVYLAGYTFIGFCTLVQFGFVLTQDHYLEVGECLNESNIRNFASKSLQILLTPLACRIILTLFVTGFIFTVASFFIIHSIL